MTELQLSRGAIGMTILPEMGGSIARLDHYGDAGVESLLRGSDAPRSMLDCASFPLVPYANRIRDGRFIFRGREVVIAPNMAGDPSPLHGWGWLMPWTVEESDTDRALLAHLHEPGEWPWHYRAEQRFTLDANGMTVRLTCRNLSDDPMPCGLGIHPYFPCDERTTIKTQVERVWTIDEKVLPIGAEPATGRYALDGTTLCGRGLDHGYDGWSGEALFRYPERAFDTRMSSPTARFFQLYSPPEGGYVAAEPVGHRNAALNEPEAQWGEAGLQVLAPGEACTLEMRVEIVPKG